MASKWCRCLWKMASFQEEILGISKEWWRSFSGKPCSANIVCFYSYFINSWYNAKIQFLIKRRNYAQSWINTLHRQLEKTNKPRIYSCWYSTMSDIQGQIPLIDHVCPRASWLRCLQCGDCFRSGCETSTCARAKADSWTRPVFRRVFTSADAAARHRGTYDPIVNPLILNWMKFHPMFNAEGIDVFTLCSGCQQQFYRTKAYLEYKGLLFSFL